MRVVEFVLLYFTLCSIYINEISGQYNSCSQSPCLNGGLCQPDDKFGFLCECSEPYGGDRCENDKSESNLVVKGDGKSIDTVNVNVKRPIPNNANSGGTVVIVDVKEGCLNGGTRPSVHEPCLCLPGFNGEYCEFDANQQTHVKIEVKEECLNGGSRGSFGLSCNCPMGFTGSRCEIVSKSFSNININSYQSSSVCYPNPCHNNGICTPTLFSYECACLPTYYGSACEVLRPYHYYYTSRFIWATLGTILLLLLLCCLIGLCIYGCIAASRYFGRGGRGGGRDFFTRFNRHDEYYDSSYTNGGGAVTSTYQVNTQPPNYTSNSTTYTQVQTHDIDESYKVNMLPPQAQPYQQTIVREEIIRRDC